MRIAMVGPFGFHPNKTMRARALRLGHSLTERDHTVRMVLPPWQTPAEGGQTWTEARVQICLVPVHGGPLATTRRMIRETLAWQPEIVHCFKPKAYSGLVAWWLWQFNQRKVGLVVDSDDWEGAGGWNERMPYPGWQKRLFAWQERWGMKHCHLLTVASKALQSVAWSHGVPHCQVFYLPNGAGIDIKPIRDRSAIRARLGLGDRPTILLYSRLFEFDTKRLVAVLRQVKQALPQLAVLSVGSGLFDAEASAFREQLVSADLMNNVIDVGWVGEEELPELLAAADVGIYLMEDTLLNRTKCPVKLADMIAYGIPVVGEAVGQVQEYVRHRETGLLSQSGDQEGMVANLIALLRDLGRRERMRQLAAEWYQQRFSWPVQVERLESHYASLSSRSGKR